MILLLKKLIGKQIIFIFYLRLVLALILVKFYIILISASSRNG